MQSGSFWILSSSGEVLTVLVDCSANRSKLGEVPASVDGFLTNEVAPSPSLTFILPFHPRSFPLSWGAEHEGGEEGEKERRKEGRGSAHLPPT